MPRKHLKSVWEGSMLRAISGGTIELGMLDENETRVRVYSDFVIVSPDEDELVKELNSLIDKYKI